MVIGAARAIETQPQLVPSARALPVAARTHTHLGTVAVVEGAASDVLAGHARFSLSPRSRFTVRSKQWMGDFSTADPGSSLGVQKLSLFFEHFKFNHYLQPLHPNP